MYGADVAAERRPYARCGIAILALAYLNTYLRVIMT